MLLDVAEALCCPRCGPPQALVVLVQRMEGRRVVAGSLACPTCEARFEVVDGRLDFRDPDAGPAALGPALAAGGEGSAAGARSDEDAVVVAALLGIRDGRGLLVTGPGLEATAARIGALCGGCEVLQLGEARDSDSPPASALALESREANPPTSLVGVVSEALPLLDARVLGVALESGDSRSIAEAKRVLMPGGRLVVLRPAPGAGTAVRGEGLEPIAEDAKAIVARRV